MRHAPLDGNAGAGGRSPSPVADRDVERAFQHDEVLLLLAVDVQRHAVVRIGHDLDDSIGAHRLRRGDADLEALSRRDLQPLAIVWIAGSANFGCFRYRHLFSPISFCTSMTMDEL